MRLSKNLSLAEVTRSATALRLGIANEPTPEHLQNLMRIAEHIFQPTRDFLGEPLFVSSGYRSTALNKAINGSLTSSHKEGNALDLDQGEDNAKVFYFILNNLDFDQLIWEFGDDPAEPNANPAWVHVGYVGEKNRNEVLIAYRHKGRTMYTRW